MNFFKSQDVARKNTLKLVFFFVLAVLSLIILTNLLVFGITAVNNSGQFSLRALERAFHPEVALLITASVAILIVLGSLYKVIVLASGGGARVAEMLGAELIIDGTGDPDKQRVLNVVEEMAIASGIPVPPVYLMDEDGINAFAAGYSPSDAIVSVTRGAITKLTRDQLQGVIAHEFSHIFNGDMKLNIRLMGFLHGILIIALIGYMVLRSSGRSRRNSKGAGAVLAAGFGLLVIGYAGVFFGNLIKAAVSRQREYLADASAVQYTRNPDGIAGALKRIGGSSIGSVIEDPGGSEISHSLFSQGISTSFSGLFATHPPLEKRIRKIDPSWNGEFETIDDTPSPQQTPTEKANADIHAAIIASVAAAALNSEQVIDQIGQPTPEHISYARNLLAELPEELKKSAHEPFGARAVIYLLVLDKDKAMRDKQLQHLSVAADSGVYDETIRLLNHAQDIKDVYRIPIVDMALPALKQLSQKQYLLFKENLEILIRADSKVSLFEWSIKRIVLHHLEAVFGKKHRRWSKNLSLGQTRESCEVLISLIAYAGKQQNITEEDAFNKAASEITELDLKLIPKKELSLDALNDALDELSELKPLQKPQLLKACASCITADQQITSGEIELFRAIADTLDCPMPPLII